MSVNTSWDSAAEWYHGLVGERGMGLQKDVVFPRSARLLSAKPHEKLLDVACGQGAFCRFAGKQWGSVTGFDASKRLIDFARRTSPRGIRYFVGDARRFPDEVVRSAPFDAVSCILALQNIEDPLVQVFKHCASVLRPGGRMLAVMTHPCFRIPRQSGWEWDEKRKLQYRRVDRYLTPLKVPIQTHPGSNARQITWTFHRPLQDYIQAIVQAGLYLDALEEWTTNRVSTPGPRARADQRSKEEIPLFLALRAKKA